MTAALPNAIDPDAGNAGSGARAEGAYQFLRTRLLEGELEAGDDINVVAVARELGCSRVPVMEALKRLAREGFVDIVPQVGCRVVRPRVDDVRDFFQLFAGVEGTVGRLAAERRTTTDVDAFRQTCRRIDQTLAGAGGVAARDPTYRRVNLLFHGAIHRMAGSPVSTAIAASLWDRSDFYIKHAFGSLYFSRAVRQAHARIRRAIIAGNGDDSHNAIGDHLRAVGARVAGKLETEDC